MRAVTKTNFYIFVGVLFVPWIIAVLSIDIKALMEASEAIHQSAPTFVFKSPVLTYLVVFLSIGFIGFSFDRTENANLRLISSVALTLGFFIIIYLKTLDHLIIQKLDRDDAYLICREDTIFFRGRQVLPKIEITLSHKDIGCPEHSQI